MANQPSPQVRFSFSSLIAMAIPAMAGAERLGSLCRSQFGTLIGEKHFGLIQCLEFPVVFVSPAFGRFFITQLWKTPTSDSLPADALTGATHTTQHAHIKRLTNGSRKPATFQVGRAARAVWHRRNKWKDN
jgi:hypothetical protein